MYQSASGHIKTLALLCNAKREVVAVPAAVFDGHSIAGNSSPNFRDNEGRRDDSRHL